MCRGRRNMRGRFSLDVNLKAEQARIFAFCHPGEAKDL